MLLPDRRVAVLVLAGYLLSFSSSAALLDREEWTRPPAVLPSKGTELSSDDVLTGGCLRRLVHECSRQLGLGGLRCEGRVGEQDDVRAPHVSTHPSCGSEVFLATKLRGVDLVCRICHESHARHFSIGPKARTADLNLHTATGLENANL